MSRRTLRCRLFGCVPTFRWSAPHIICKRCREPYQYRGEAR